MATPRSAIDGVLGGRGRAHISRIGYLISSSPNSRSLKRVLRTKLWSTVRTLSRRPSKRFEEKHAPPHRGGGLVLSPVAMMYTEIILLLAVLDLGLGQTLVEREANSVADDVVLLERLLNLLYMRESIFRFIFLVTPHDRFVAPSSVGRGRGQNRCWRC